MRLYNSSLFIVGRAADAGTVRLNPHCFSVSAAKEAKSCAVSG